MASKKYGRLSEEGGRPLSQPSPRTSSAMKQSRMQKFKSNLKSAVSRGPGLQTIDSSKEFAEKVEGYHITRYDSSALLGSILGFLRIKGTVFGADILFTVVFYDAIAFAYGLFICDTGAGNDGSCLYRPTDKAALAFASLAAFLIGIYTNTIFHRWWAMRGALGGVIGEMIDFIFLLRAAMPQMNAKAESIIKTQRRWCVLAHSMIWLSANDDLSDTRRLEILQEMLQEGTMQPAEEELLKESAAANWMIIYNWQLRSIYQYYHTLSPSAQLAFKVRQLSAQIFSMRARSMQLMTHIKQQVPFAYAHLMAFVIRVHLLLFALYGAQWLGDAMHENENWLDFFFGITVISLNTTIFSGLFSISAMLENPMGGDANDFVFSNFEKTLDVTTRLSLAETPMPFKETDQRGLASAGDDDDDDHQGGGMGGGVSGGDGLLTTIELESGDHE